MGLNKVVALIFDGIHPFEFGVACEAFGIDRSDDGLPRYDFVVASESAEPVSTNNGFTLNAEHRFDQALDADLVIVSAGAHPCIPASVAQTLASAYANGAAVMGLCTAFAVAAFGMVLALSLALALAFVLLGCGSVTSTNGGSFTLIVQ